MRLATRAVRLFVAAFALLLVSIASPAIASPAAAARAVTIQNFTFAPPTLTVSVGDTITWTNQDPSQHSAKATGGSFDTGALSQGSAKTITFTVAGTFAYECAFHPSTMRGTVVVVVAPTPPPTVAPTPVPTVRTAQPTPVPTVAPTAQATVATIAPATPTPATAAPATTAATSTAPVAVASPATTASATPPSDAGGPGPLIIGGAVAIVVGLGALAWVLLRR